MHGPPVPPQQRLLLYSAAQWEDFVHEWAHFCLKTIYVQVERFGNAGDRGIDVLGFSDARKLNGVWDNYQCKHYDHPLFPTEAWPEIGKLLWYTFKKEYRSPRRYFFVAPKGVGTSLAGLLADPPKLKEHLMAGWDKYCRTAITKTEEIALTGPFRDYVGFFDFTIFDTKTSLQLVDDHRSSPHHSLRFGGGLPTRPPVAEPPSDLAAGESTYVSQLLGAYAEHKKTAVPDIATLRMWAPLSEHFKRQREAFYHAESLRIFARDTVPTGTFESLQKDIYDGVVDTHDADHADGYVRVCRVTEAARNLNLTENALLSAARPKDRDGVCHQLANDDRLRWTKS
ncbi:MAG: ABC-three component system protein [Thermoanaerobaculia bacterium]